MQTVTVELTEDKINSLSSEASNYDLSLGDYINYKLTKEKSCSYKKVNGKSLLCFAGYFPTKDLKEIECYSPLINWTKILQYKGSEVIMNAS